MTKTKRAATEVTLNIEGHALRTNGFYTDTTLNCISVKVSCCLKPAQGGVLRNRR